MLKIFWLTCRQMRPLSWSLVCKRSFADFRSRTRTRELNFDLSKEVTKDTLVYQGNISRLKKSQLAVICFSSTWLYLSWFCWNYLQDEPISEEEKRIRETGRDEKSKLYNTWEKLTHFNDKYKLFMTAFCLLMAFGSIGLSYFYTSRNILDMTLKAGGKNVSIRTIPGLVFREPKSRTLPLMNLSVSHSDSRVDTLKIQGTSLFYLVSKDGKIPNENLYIRSVGARRNLSD